MELSVQRPVCAPESAGALSDERGDRQAVARDLHGGFHLPDDGRSDFAVGGEGDVDLRAGPGGQPAVARVDGDGDEFADGELQPE